MKNFYRILLSVLCVFILSVPVYAAETPAAAMSPQYTLTVNGEIQDLSDLPRAPYEDNGFVMIPLCKTAEGLGYTVTWLSNEQGIQIEDNIQSATVHNGSCKVRWVGKLKTIKLTRDSTLDSEVKILNGRTYVPAPLFESFFNDVVIGKGNISISPKIATPDYPNYTYT